ncbi:MAG: MFS transporter [Lachnospiraceae bacterium]|nr:MFS transporter [Lachnospiraceae bacterium]
MAKEFKYRDIVKSPEYRKLLLTNLVNRFGDSVDAIAFTWLVYEITGSASWSALIFGLNMLPNIIVQPFAGPVIEKLDKKKVIVATHILRGIVISAFVGMYLAGIVNPYIMAAFTLIITTIESFNLPASTAFIPSIIKKEHLTHAMSLNSTLSSAIALVGTGLAGIIIAKFGVYTAMLIDAATFFIAAFGTSTIRRLNDVEVSEETSKEVSDSSEQASKESYMSLLKGGVKYVAKNRVILNYIFVAVILNFLLVPINSLSAPLAEDVYGLGSGLLSVAGIAFSIGAIIGSAIVPMIAEKMPAKTTLVIFGLVLSGAIYAISLGRYLYGKVLPGYLLAGSCYIVISVAASVLSGVISVMFVKVVDQSYLARAGAIFNASATAATPVGSVLVSVMALKLNPAPLIAVSAILAIVLFILVAISSLKFEMKEEQLNAAEGV